MSKLKIREITVDKDIAKITVLNVPDKPGVAARIFSIVAELGLNVDLIVHTTNEEKESDISFVIDRANLDRTLETLNEVREKLEIQDVVTETNMAMVSIVGKGLGSTPGVAARMFSALAEAGINIEMISSSMITVTCVIQKDKIEEALMRLDEKFEADELHT